MPSFFINGTSLSNATAVFLDSEQTICAPDGYYSDGVITRQQLGCSLLASIGCLSCAGDCPLETTEYLFANERIRYSVSINASYGTGAIIIRFNTNNLITGIIANFNGTDYNELSSFIYGYVAAPAGLVTYIGQSSYAIPCLCPTFPTTYICTYSVTKREWNGTAFVSIPGTESVDITFPQLLLQATGLGDCIMVIPKTSVGIQAINVYMYKLCYENNFNIEISCPEPLPSFQSSIKSNPSFPEFCGLSTTVNTFYVAKVDNTFPAPFVLVNDWVFQDENGEVKLEDGYYKTDYVIGTNNTIEVVNGVVVAVSLAPCD
jgi:hypothetical protein